MSRRVIIFLSSLAIGTGFFFWWMSQWPASVVLLESQTDLLWRTVQKTESGWQRVEFDPNNSKDLVSYQKDHFVLYGTKYIPEMSSEGSQWTITFPKQGEWILRTLDDDEKVSFTLGNMRGVISGAGGVYFNSAGVIANFDAEVMVTDKPLLPSFTLRDGQTHFFDISEERGLVSPDLWAEYMTFLDRDEERALGNITRAHLDSMIRTLMSREPTASGASSLYRNDLRAKNALQEIRTALVKIDNGESCATVSGSCIELIQKTLKEEKVDFPEVFTPLDQAIRSWYQREGPLEEGALTWKTIFHRYHLAILQGDTRARTVRDKALLDMAKLGTTTSDISTWSYLAEMLGQEKKGSVYSLQIVREMLRTGDELYREKNTSVEEKNQITTQTLEALTNLKNVLENTYFTKKEYWFVLRDDLVDSDGGVMQNQVFVRDLQELVKQMDTSALFAGQVGDNEKKLATIRAQLTWFNCIFGRNAEYVSNPRICRTTTV